MTEPIINDKLFSRKKKLSIIAEDIESSTVTSEFGGKFKTEQTRREFLNYIQMDTKF